MEEKNQEELYNVRLVTGPFGIKHFVLSWGETVEYNDIADYEYYGMKKKYNGGNKRKYGRQMK